MAETSLGFWKGEVVTYHDEIVDIPFEFTSKTVVVSGDKVNRR